MERAHRHRGTGSIVTISLGSPQNVNGGPWSGQSDQDAYFPVSASTTTPAIDVTLVFKNLITGVGKILVFGFTPFKDISSAVFLKVNFNTDLPTLPPSICGSGDEFQCFANVDFSGNGTVTSPTIIFTVVRSPCICTEIMDVFTTIDSYTCVGEDGKIGVQGKLFAVTCSGGIPSPFVNQPAAILVGLEDPATGIFYEYTAASTDGTGTFSIGFGIGSLSNVLALVPVDGNKQFNLILYYPGNETHTPSTMFSKGVTIVGKQAGSAPCALGTLLVDTLYGTAPKGAEVHNFQLSFAGGIPSVSDFNALATQVRDKVHDSIISAGSASTPVTPLEIKVYRGPDIQVPSFFGFIGLSSGSFNVVATAMGSPVAGLVIVAIIVVALVILAFFVFLIMSTVKDIIAIGGGPTLTAIAVAVTAVAVVGGGLALYFGRKISAPSKVAKARKA